MMKFPHDYPYSPPSVKFLTKMWHPNVYEVSSCSAVDILTFNWLHYLESHELAPTENQSWMQYFKGYYMVWNLLEY